MLTHFTYQPFIATDSRRREFQISFYYKGTQYRGVYHYNGAIDWDEEPDTQELEKVVSHVHELMLFHVYE